MLSSDTILYTVGNGLKSLLKKKSWKITDLSQKTCISAKNISNYLQGRAVPPLNSLTRIANAFSISVDYLIQGNNSEYVWNIALFDLASKISLNNRSLAAQIITTTLGSKTTNKINPIRFDYVAIKLSDNFSENVSLLRQKKGLSQRTLAKKINLANTSVMAYEHGNSLPSILNLESLANIFSVSIHFLTTGKKLKFEFTDEQFLKLVCAADRVMQYSDIDFTIRMMQKLTNKKIPPPRLKVPGH